MHPVPERTEERHGRLVGDEDPLVPRHDQGIAFPVPDPATTFHGGRAGIDADPVFQVSPPLRPRIALTPLSPTAQRPVLGPPGLAGPA